MRLAFVVGWTIGWALWATPAEASQTAEVPVSRLEWEQRVLESGGLTPELLEEFRRLPRLPAVQISARVVDPVPKPPPVPRTPAPTAEAWRELVSGYFAPGDVDRALRVIWCESRGDPLAKNPTSTASGLWQFLRAWWAGEWGYPFDPFDPTASTKRAAELVYGPGQGWDHWLASRSCWDR